MARLIPDLEVEAQALLNLQVACVAMGDLKKVEERGFNFGRISKRVLCFIEPAQNLSGCLKSPIGHFNLGPKAVPRELNAAFLRCSTRRDESHSRLFRHPLRHFV